MPCCSIRGSERRDAVARSLSKPLSTMRLSLSNEPFEWLEMCWIFGVDEHGMPLHPEAVLTFDCLDDPVGAPRGRRERSRVGNGLVMLGIHFGQIREQLSRQ